MIHSTSDGVVLYKHALLSQEAYPGLELWRLEGYDHVEAYTHPRYEERLLGFLKDAGAPPQDARRGSAEYKIH